MLTHIPDLASFHWIILNTSGGKDSGAMVDAVVKECRRLGLMDRVVAVHADLGRVEWSGVKELAERQVRAAGVERFNVVSRDRDLLSQIEHERKKFPGLTAMANFCTSDHKTSQIAKFVTTLIREARANGTIAKGEPCRVLHCLGFTPDEGGERGAKCAKITHPTARQWNGSRHCTTWYPLHDWSIDKVWDYIRGNDLEYHPAYDHGMSRLSCVFCVMANRNDLMIAGEHNPELLAEYVRVEKAIEFSFKHKLPIVDIQTALANGERGDPEKTSPSRFGCPVAA